MPALKVGNVEIHWIDNHKEKIAAEDKFTEVHGMKVKMRIPDPANPDDAKKELWAWVVVDRDGNIETFERNIFWNFTEFKRETQMWLHDNWLKAHNISLPETNHPNNTRLGAKL